MGQYTAPLRDMQFVLHELLGAEAELKAMPPHADFIARNCRHNGGDEP